MKYLGFLVMGIICLTVIGPILMIAYYWLCPIVERALWKLKQSRTDVLRPMVSRFPVKINEISLNEFVHYINDKMKLRVSGNMDRIKTITTSTDPDGICYITIWYKSKDHSVKKPSEDLMKTFRFGM